MPSNPFTVSFDHLPKVFPVFPLAGAVVMPGADLPLNIFEPRYLNMVFDVLGSHRMFGMVQPDTSASAETHAICKTGCAGRVTSFSETEDGRLLLVLTGVCRFDIGEEVDAVNGYRRVVPDWSRFRGDYEKTSTDVPEREQLFQLLRRYCAENRLEVAWDELELMRGADLVNILTCRLPLEAPDKQALIESVTLAERTQLLRGLLEMALTQQVDVTSRH
ncbi:MAG: LON peptidase substrate-binding domain-containing protein [Gammaproteobacteria bacterium]|nr:LON peptidase substrate-binding domain-containing protein [Gammaproteobacteria bacterium]